MSYCTKIVFIAIAMVACNTPDSPPKGAADTTGDDDDTANACERDGQCGIYQHCGPDNTCIEGDNDNGIDQASALLAESWAQGTIYPAGDSDWFVYTSNGDEWVRVQTKSNLASDDCTGDGSSPGDGDLDTVVAIRRANGSTHAAQDNFPTGRVVSYDSLLFAYLPDAGDYYITVEDISTWYDETPRGDKAYFYCLELLPWSSHTVDTDAWDNPSWSVDLDTAGVTWSVGVHLDSPGDADWLALNLTRNSKIEVWGQSSIPGSDAKPRIFLHPNDDPSVDLLQKDDVGPAGIASYFMAPQANYLLEATDAFGNGGPDSWYVLYLRTGDDGDYDGFEPEIEPNDVVSNANLPTIGFNSNGIPFGTMVGTLEADGDEDWFSVDIGSDEYFSIHCASDTFGALTDVGMELYDPSGTLEVVASDGNDSAPDLDNHPAASAGLYNLRLYSEDATYGAGAYYRCVYWIWDAELQF